MGVVLIGYRGSGKTTVGRLLATARAEAFIDTDELIVHFAGCSIADIFQGEGELGFRKRERHAIETATAKKDRIVSVGGGAVESEENRQTLRDYGTVVWLDAPAETLWQRIRHDPSTGDNRPDLAGGGLEEVKTILTRRAPLYVTMSHVAVRVANVTPEQIVADIETWLAARDG